ncbi:ABC transporter permease [Endomicrobiia bacterium]|nr:ABC transporter permease [Endomicrobiia bacterium]
MIPKAVVSSLNGLRQVAMMTAEVIACIFRGEISFKNTVAQMLEVGWRSTPITLLSSFPIGMVLALQVGSVTTNFFNEPLYVGAITSFTLVTELIPVLTAIVVTGRVGAAITAEIGSMKVTEQLDALYTLGTSPVRYLAVSRFLACFFMLPMLTVIANIIGVCGGMSLAAGMWKVSPATYWSEILGYMTIGIFLQGFIKSFVFALIIAIVACYKGFNTKDGAEGVGKATTSSVMSSMVLVLISNYFLTSLLIALKIK